MQQEIDNKIKIENIIYEIRGKQVMLDSDLAILYRCSNGTKTINQAVKRHINRFPERFMFQLTQEEYYHILRSQSGTLELSQGQYSKYLPYVFTEQGVAMLATIIRTSVAEEISIQIMDAFVNMRRYISTNLLEQKYINNQVIKNTENIKLLRESFDKLSEEKNYTGLFYAGQIYDSYSLLLDIFSNSNESIILIDNYVDKTILDILKKVDKDILIITNKYNKQDFGKYIEQYNNIELRIDNSFHDRFIIIDERILYHSGASFKDLGKKCFAITKMEDDKWLNNLLEYIKKNC